MSGGPERQEQKRTLTEHATHADTHRDIARASDKDNGISILGIPALPRVARAQTLSVLPARHLRPVWLILSVLLLA